MVANGRADSSSERSANPLVGLVDAPYSDADVESLADAPVEALTGVSKHDADVLRTSFGIRTIADLARYQPFHNANEIVGKASAKRQALQLIEEDTLNRGPAEARLRDSGIPIWALIGYLRVMDDDAARVASDYQIPLEAVEAALHYYRLHRAAIDARLAANEAAFVATE